MKGKNIKKDQVELKVREPRNVKSIGATAAKVQISETFGDIHDKLMDVNSFTTMYDSQIDPKLVQLQIPSNHLGVSKLVASFFKLCEWGLRHPEEINPATIYRWISEHEEGQQPLKSNDSGSKLLFDQDDMQVTPVKIGELLSDESKSLLEQGGQIEEAKLQEQLLDLVLNNRLQSFKSSSFPEYSLDETLLDEPSEVHTKKRLVGSKCIAGGFCKSVVEDSGKIDSSHDTLVHKSPRSKSPESILMVH